MSSQNEIMRFIATFFQWAFVISCLFLPLLLSNLYCILSLSLLNCVIAQQVNINQTTAALSEARTALAATSSGELVFFGGGYNTTNGTSSDRVDICNVTSGIWTTATLSVPRFDLAATSSCNLVFFAGGWNWTIFYNQVDIYNISNGIWSIATLSQARSRLAATSVGSVVLFAGGYNSSNDSNVIFNIVDIYNVPNNTWTSATLSQARYWLAATSVANRYALFAGGFTTSNFFSSVLDIFDSLNGTWNTTTLSEPRVFLAAASLGNLSFFASGTSIDIFNPFLQTWSSATLSQSRYQLAAASTADIVSFAGGYDGFTFSSVVDMYSVTNNIWFTTTLSQARAELAATSSISTNKIFFGGGINISTNSGVSNAVDIFDISLVPFTSLSTMSPATSSYIASLAPLLFWSPSIVSSYSPSTSPSASNIILAIVFGVIGTLLLVGAVVFFVIILKKRRKRRKLITSESSETAWMGRTTTNESTSTTVRSKTIKLDSTMHKILRKSQIPSYELLIDKEIGEGTYGKVFLGRWNNMPVALKFCIQKGTISDILRETKIIVHLPPHPNVLQVFGVSLEESQIILVLEYCERGSLDKLLFNPYLEISEDYKMQLIRGIAAGMQHLHKHNIVHRDLAARNILLTSKGEPKLSDFGLSRILEKFDDGETQSKLGPMRWMPPESLAQKNYSKKSDVWSFGLVVYEIVTRSEPHKDRNIVEVLVKIRDEGLTPAIPSDCPKKLRQLMEMCWNKEPEQRPTFETICSLLGN
jgi:hypothetical protein